MAQAVISGVVLFQFWTTHMSGYCDFYIRSRDGREFHASGVGLGFPLPEFLRPFCEARFTGRQNEAEGLIACEWDQGWPKGWNIAWGTITQADLEKLEHGRYEHAWKPFGYLTCAELPPELQKEADAMRRIAEIVLAAREIETSAGLC